MYHLRAVFYMNCFNKVFLCTADTVVSNCFLRILGTFNAFITPSLSLPISISSSSLQFPFPV